MTAPLLTSPVQVTSPGGPSVVVGVSPGRPGPPGTGVNLAGAVATYADLPTNLGIAGAGAAYVVQATGKLYVWSGTAWPPESAGADFRGEQGPTGIGIAGITADTEGLIFDMTEGPNKAVAVPAIAAATAAAQAAAQSAADADTDRLASEQAAVQTGQDKAVVNTAKADTVTARDATYTARDEAAQSALDADADRQAAETAKTDAQTATTKATEATQTAQTVSNDAARAELARSGAETAETNAGQHAAAASSSETNAGTSELNAHNSELAAAQSAQEAANAVNDGIADATATVKGGIMLPGGADGELGGTYDHPVVTGWAKKADLVDGVVPSSQIPAIALVDTFVVVDEAERLALGAQTGDIAILTGNPGRGTYILKGVDPSAAADWVPFTVPEGAVTSVNGYTGIIVLGKADVGLGNVDNTSDLAKPVSTAQQTALDGKVPTSRTVSAGTGLTGGGALDQDRSLAVEFGTTEGKVAQGNDSRLSDKRVPVDGSVHTVSLADGAVTAPKLAPGVLPHDMTIPVVGDKGTRAVGAGDLSGGVCLQRDGHQGHPVSVPIGGGGCARRGAPQERHRRRGHVVEYRRGRPDKQRRKRTRGDRPVDRGREG